MKLVPGANTGLGGFVQKGTNGKRWLAAEVLVVAVLIAPVNFQLRTTALLMIIQT